ncbi:MAG: hypothetical protein O7D86_09955 [Proteobacteria bacterium]|nr:hypothetical protein [Pseudomonadota bacterium]
MAKPIKETPVLMGDDARRFEEEIEANESNKVSDKEYEKVMEDYRRFTVE